MLETEDEGPVLPPNVEELDEETFDEVYEFAHNRWEAEWRVRATSLDPIKIPAVKFHTNENEALTARECRLVAETLRATTVPDVRAAYEADEENLKSWEMWSNPPEEVADTLHRAMGAPPPYDEYIAGLHESAQGFANYLETAARFLGVRVR